jgi:hypothetical protein
MPNTEGTIQFENSRLTRQDHGWVTLCGGDETNMPKVYMRAANAVTFEWVDKPEYATSYDKNEMELILKRFDGAKLERAPEKHPRYEHGWIISKEV